MTKSALMFLFSLLVAFPCYSDIAGDVSIGKDGDTYKGNMKIGYDISMGDITLIPFVDYVNYFTYENGGHPFRDVFGCGIKAEYKDVYILIRHECIHEVSSVNSLDKPVLYEDAEKNKSSTWIICGLKWGKDF